MSRLGWRWLTAALTFALAAGGCDELPTDDQERRRLVLALVDSGPIIVGDTGALRVQATDPDGRILLAPPLVWQVTWGGRAYRAAVVRSDSSRGWLVGESPGVAHTNIGVPVDDPRFWSDNIFAEIPVQYGPITIRFVGVDSVLVLDRLSNLRIPVSTTDHRGRKVPPDGLRLDVTGDGFLDAFPNTNGEVRVYPQRDGVHELVVSHDACVDPCADTMVLRVRQVPAWVEILPGIQITSLGDTAKLPVRVADSANMLIEAPNVIWNLLDPVDSLIIDLFDPTEGLVFARRKGSARVAATLGELSDTGSVSVWPLVHHWEVHGLDSTMVGAGTVDTVAVLAWDARDNPIADPRPTWRRRYNGIFTVEPLGIDRAVITAHAIGESTLYVDMRTHTPNPHSETRSYTILVEEPEGD